MTHYEVLGVSPKSSTDTIRQAYVAAAREAHPDVAGEAGAEAMRRINAAWATLSDPTAREEYDLGFPDGPKARPTTVRRPTARPFVPYNEVDVDDDDEWRYTDDDTDPATAPGSVMQLAPVAMVVLGMALVILGGIVGLAPVLALGAAFVLLGAVGFLIVPLMVMARASTVEQRRERNRS